MFTGTNEGLELTDAARDVLHSLGNKWIETHNTNLVDFVPAPGPYVIDGQELLQVSKLYDDILGAFLTGLISSNDSRFRELRLPG